eukprot:3993510-Pyramimonas_sp.AAC.1
MPVVRKKWVDARSRKALGVDWACARPLQRKGRQRPPDPGSRRAPKVYWSLVIQKCSGVDSIPFSK